MKYTGVLRIVKCPLVKEGDIVIHLELRKVKVIAIFENENKRNQARVEIESAGYQFDVEICDLRVFEVEYTSRNTSTIGNICIPLSKANWDQFIAQVDDKGYFKSNDSFSDHRIIDFNVVNGEACVPLPIHLAYSKEDILMFKQLDLYFNEKAVSPEVVKDHFNEWYKNKNHAD